MEPITITLGTALALGAAAGLKPTAEAAVKDAYQGLKTLIQRRFAKVSLAQLEESPDSKARRAVVEEDLEKAGADKDEELLKHAKALIELIRQQDPSAARVVGVDLEDFKAGSVRIADVASSGTAVKARRVEVGGSFEISGVQAGVGERDAAKKS